MYAFCIFGKDYVRKLYFGTFYPLLHLLWEDSDIPVFLLLLSVTLKALWKVTEVFHALPGTHTPWSVRAVGHLAPGAAPQPGHGHFVPHSAVGWVHPWSKRRENKWAHPRLFVLAFWRTACQECSPTPVKKLLFWLLTEAGSAVWSFIPVLPCSTVKDTLRLCLREEVRCVLKSLLKG